MWKTGILILPLLALGLVAGCGGGGNQALDRGIYVEYTGRYVVSQLDDGWVVTAKNVRWAFDELAYHMKVDCEKGADSQICNVDGFYALTDQIELTPYAARLPDGAPCDSADLVYNPTGTFDFVRLGDTIKLFQHDTLNGLVKELVLYR